MRETLRFAAIIKLPSSVSRERKLAKVEELLKMLGLKECADGLVGGELLKGISGGERRRLSLACEMVGRGHSRSLSQLNAIHIDQRSGGVDLGRTGMSTHSVTVSSYFISTIQTSGLDANTARTIVEVLRNIARSG